MKNLFTLIIINIITTAYLCAPGSLSATNVCNLTALASWFVPVEHACNSVNCSSNGASHFLVSSSLSL